PTALEVINANLRGPGAAPVPVAPFLQDRVRHRMCDQGRQHLFTAIVLHGNGGEILDAIPKIEVEKRSREFAVLSSDVESALAGPEGGSKAIELPLRLGPTTNPSHPELMMLNHVRPRIIRAFNVDREARLEPLADEVSRFLMARRQDLGESRLSIPRCAELGDLADASVPRLKPDRPSLLFDRIGDRVWDDIGGREALILDQTRESICQRIGNCRFFLELVRYENIAVAAKVGQRVDNTTVWATGRKKR